MKKYIDSERLKDKIEFLKKTEGNSGDPICDIGVNLACNRILSFIDSFRQEQKDIIVLNKKDWEKQEQFRKDKKFGIPLQQEHPNVNFEKELDRIWFDEKFGDNFDNSAVDFANVRWICNYFYELGNNARKEE